MDCGNRAGQLICADAPALSTVALQARLPLSILPPLPSRLRQIFSVLSRASSGGILYCQGIGYGMENGLRQPCRGVHGCLPYSCGPHRQHLRRLRRHGCRHLSPSSLVSYCSAPRSSDTLGRPVNVAGPGWDRLRQPCRRAPRCQPCRGGLVGTVAAIYSPSRRVSVIAIHRHGHAAVFPIYS